jgi:molybdenum cofactor cytidylyltransferase
MGNAEVNEPNSPLPTGNIAAIVAAAGRSTRMGEPKQLLPWGQQTVLGAVATHLTTAGASPVLCVVGHRAAEMCAALSDASARLVNNPDYLQGEMLSSYQAGLRHLLAEQTAYLGFLVALGDQPHIPVEVIHQVIAQARLTPHQIVIPSYKMRRGHPFFIPAQLWPELLALSQNESLRTLVQRHQTAITYVDVATDAILNDIDTPADYQNLSVKNSAATI